MLDLDQLLLTFPIKVTAVEVERALLSVVVAQILRFFEIGKMERLVCLLLVSSLLLSSHRFTRAEDESEEEDKPKDKKSKDDKENTEKEPALKDNESNLNSGHKSKETKTGEKSEEKPPERSKPKPFLPLIGTVLKFASALKDSARRTFDTFIG